MNLSLIGIVHTFLGLIGVLAAFYMIFRDQKIDPETPAGLVYFITITLSCILVFFLPHMLAAGFNPGHVLTILTLGSLFLGFFVRFSQIRGRLYIQAIALSMSLFFTLVPTIKETLTRLPVGAPFATSEQDPLVLNSFGVLTVLFLGFCLMQILKLRNASKLAIGVI
jgi:hypothetical protein